MLTPVKFIRVSSGGVSIVEGNFRVLLGVEAVAPLSAMRSIFFKRLRIPEKLAIHSVYFVDRKSQIVNHASQNSNVQNVMIFNILRKMARGACCVVKIAKSVQMPQVVRCALRHII